jgi:hypothetical protein
LHQPVNSGNPRDGLEIFANARKTVRRINLGVYAGVVPGNILREMVQKVDIEGGGEILKPTLLSREFAIE